MGCDRRLNCKERPCPEGFEFNPKNCEKPVTGSWVAAILLSSLLSASEHAVFLWHVCPSPGAVFS